MDDLTPYERAQIEVERHVYDFCAVASRLTELRKDPMTAPFFSAIEEARLSEAMLRLQLTCSQPKKPELAIVRAS